MPEVAAPSILVVEDDDQTREYFAATLEASGGASRVCRAPDLEAGRKALRCCAPEVMLVDLNALLTGSEGWSNPLLRRGDVVYVPRSLIASIDRFFTHYYLIVRPIVDTATGIWLGQNIDAGPRRTSSNNSTVIYR